MTIGYNLEEFNGKPVKDYERSTGVENPQGVAYRLRVVWGSWRNDSDEDESVEAQLKSFAEDPRAKDVTELVIGAWSLEGGGCEGVAATLVEIAERLPNLEALMVGDITYEESEISWIEQTDLGPVVRAYPKLREFRARGGNGLRVSNLEHANLRKLVLETGGMSSRTISDVAAAKLPALEHLELWLGTDNYGFDASIHNLRPFLTAGRFEKLGYLGLRDSEIADEIAQALATGQAADPSTVDVEGKTFVLTGALATLTRGEAKKRLEARGAKVSSSVSKNTDYLVAGDKAGSKYEKAKELDVPVLSEGDLLKLLGEEATGAITDASASILDQIHTLDLSMGTLSDVGAKALYENPKIKNLDKLDVHYHYISDAWIEKLKSLSIEVDASDQQDLDEDPEWRYVAVSE